MTIHFLTVTHIHMTPTQADIERSRQGDLIRKKANMEEDTTTNIKVLLY